MRVPADIYRLLAGIALVTCVIHTAQAQVAVIAHLSVPEDSLSRDELASLKG